ncbi:sodium/mannose cotransporter SLC5A10-like [Oratosquilla oratoria]|uniref:sodium/mannose cotransporter SLC5A10-like n=1 Tax=Oratosquilla oratoria TaxID=337810 RepID=UPI003F75CC5B
MADSEEEFIFWDYLAIVVYFLLNLGVGIYALWRPNRGTISGYFLAGRFMWWLPVGASLFASNIGSEHFVGLAGSGAAGGIGIGAFNFNSLMLLQLMGWVFIPVFIASGVCTVPEYMSKRFGGQRIQAYLAVLSLILYIFTKISVDLYSGALFINQALHWDIYFSMILLLGLTALFTMTGGLAAVIYTDTLQFFIMIIGAMMVMVKAFQKVGGYEALQYKYMQAIPKLTYENTTCGIPRADSWIMLRDPVNSDLPWPAFLLGQTPASVWYWCADQMMVQRTLAAKSLSHAQGATLFAAYIKILPFFMIILPGMISRVLYPDDVACVLPEECMRACGSTVSCFNSAYPRLVIGIMPAGLKGFMMAVMLAALMSDLTSIFNSASTMFTIDLWKRVRPHAKTRELLVVGKMFIVFLVLVSIAWVPIIEKMQGGQLFIYIQKIGAYLAPPIAVIYTLAVLWPRMNEKGAFFGLMVGLGVGLVRMILDFSFPPPKCYEEDTRPRVISEVNFMYFAMMLCWITGITAAAVSLLTEPPEKYRLIRTTYRTRHDKMEREDDQEYVARLTGSDQESSATVSPSDNPVSTTAIHASDVQLNSEESPERRNGQSNAFKRAWVWLCGYETESLTKEEQSEMQDHLRNITSLEQDPRAKMFLNANLVIVIVIGVGLFVFFTRDPFPEGFDPKKYQQSLV